MNVCADGCGAPLVDGECKHCGRTYPEGHPIRLSNMEDVVKFVRTEEEEEWDRSTEQWIEDTYEPEEEIVAMGSDEEIKADFGPSYEPGLMEVGFGGTFEDGQGALMMIFVACMVVGILIGFFAPPVALPFLFVGLIAALLGGIRQMRHKETE